MLKRENLLFYYMLVVIFMTFQGINYLSFVSLIFILVYSFINADGKLKLRVCKNSTMFFYCFIIYAILVTVISYKSGIPAVITDVFTVIINRYIVMFITLTILIKDANLDRFFQIVKKSGWIIVILGIIEEITRYNITFPFLSESYINNLTSEGRIFSMFMHPIPYAFILLVLLTILIYEPYTTMIKNYLYTVLIILNVLFTRTRGAILVFFIMFMLVLIKKGYLFIKHRGKALSKISSNKVHMIIILVLISFATFIILHSRISAFLGDYYSRLIRIINMSDQGIRLGVISNYFAYAGKISISRVLFGSGEGFSFQFMKLYPIGIWSYATDNMYITFLLNYGVLGVLFIGFPVVWAIKEFITLQDTSTMSYKVVVSIFIIISIMNFTFESFYWPITLFFYILSIVVFGKSKTK